MASKRKNKKTKNGAAKDFPTRIFAVGNLRETVLSSLPDDMLVGFPKLRSKYLGEASLIGVYQLVDIVERREVTEFRTAGTDGDWEQWNDEMENK